jgi:hypothetical protein
VNRELRDDWATAFPRLTIHVVERNYADAQVFGAVRRLECLLVDKMTVAIVGELAALVVDPVAAPELVSSPAIWSG